MKLSERLFGRTSAPAVTNVACRELTADERSALPRASAGLRRLVFTHADGTVREGSYVMTVSREAALMATRP